MKIIFLISIVLFQIGSINTSSISSDSLTYSIDNEQKTTLLYNINRIKTEIEETCGIKINEPQFLTSETFFIEGYLTSDSNLMEYKSQAYKISSYELNSCPQELDVLDITADKFGLEFRHLYGYATTAGSTLMYSGSFLCDVYGGSKPHDTDESWVRFAEIRCTINEVPEGLRKIAN